MNLKQICRLHKETRDLRKAAFSHYCRNINLMFQIRQRKFNTLINKLVSADIDTRRELIHIGQQIFIYPDRYDLFFRLCRSEFIHFRSSALNFRLT